MPDPKMGPRALIPLFVAGLLELSGIAAIVVGFAILSPIAGWIAGGIGLTLLGLAVDPPFRRPKTIEVE